jgi:hypothetical protein
MTRGQESLGIDVFSGDDEFDANNPVTTPILVQMATVEETADHEACLDNIGKKRKDPVVWRREQQGSV